MIRALYPALVVLQFFMNCENLQTAFPSGCLCRCSSQIKVFQIIFFLRVGAGASINRFDPVGNNDDKRHFFSGIPKGMSDHVDENTTMLNASEMCIFLNPRLLGKRRRYYPCYRVTKSLNLSVFFEFLPLHGLLTSGLCKQSSNFVL